LIDLARWHAATSLSLLLSLAALGLAAPARADDLNRFSILEENDSLYFNSDKHYTQGFLLSNLGPDIRPDSGWQAPFNLLGDLTPLFSTDGENARRYAVLFGQSIFTPKNLTVNPPDPRDRPYAGWAYVGTSLLQESRHSMLENFEIDVGVVGPGALGKQVQNNFHQLIGAQQAQGWRDQIQNEPGLVLTYERLWRVPLIGDGYNGVDIVPQAGATVGNIFTYGDVGGLLRIGKNLHADYGPNRVRPGLSGTPYFDGGQLDGPVGWYFYAGAQGRAVAQNIFLDGNTFRESPSVPKKTFVADLQSGFSVIWSTKLRVDFSVVRRTEEFRGQKTPDEVGTAALAFSW
jgi:hypothetical protein